MAEGFQVYRVFEALFCSLACFVIHLCSHGRDLVEFNLNLMVWRFRLICFAFLVVDLVVLGVILLFLDISRWKLRKIVRDLE